MLPPVPIHILTSRLLAAQTVAGAASKYVRRQSIRSGLWIGSGSAETNRLGIRAQYAGVKQSLRRTDYLRGQSHSAKPNLNSVLTSADWKTMLDELQMSKALDMVERLKAEKAWSYMQLKKQRTPSVPKCHWDHLLDEMSWLHVDFRQERRWKIAIAFRLAHQIAAWHRSDPVGRRALQVPLRVQPALGASSSAEGIDSRLPLREGADPNINSSLPRLSGAPTQSLVESAPNDRPSPCPSAQGSPESFRSTNPLRSAIATDSNSSNLPAKLSAGNPGKRQPSPHEARRALHQAKRCRVFIYDTDPWDPVIDPSRVSLADICPKSGHYPVEHIRLNKWFGDLPLFGDLDSRPDKRPDEAGPHYGRITRVAPHFESKPLLVSTLQPSRNCALNRWKNLDSLAVDDARENAEARPDPNHHQPHLFSGRKSKDIKLTNTVNQPLPPPVPTGPERKDPLLLAPSDEERLKQICLVYGFNWRLIADLFNSSFAGPVTHRLTPRDCYDCWVRLHHSPQPPGDANSHPSPCKAAPEPSTSALPTVPASGAPAIAAETAAQEEPNEGMADDSANQAPGVSPLFPVERTARDIALQEIALKVKQKRHAAAPKLLPPDQPRQINLTSHETHTQPLRPYMSPLEMSVLKAERDKQAQVALEMAKRQQQLQHDSFVHQSRAVAVVAANSQATSKTPSANAPSSSNGSMAPRVLPQGVTSFNSTRNGALLPATVHRQTTPAPGRYSAGHHVHSVNNRIITSLTGISSSHQGVSSSECQVAVAATTGTQPPILPQLPVIPQGFQTMTSGSQPSSNPPSSSNNQQTRSGSPRNSGGLHNSVMTHGLTPVQVAQYLQQQIQQQHQLHQQQHGAQSQHQQPHLIHQHQAQMQQQFHPTQHHSPPYVHATPTLSERSPQSLNHVQLPAHATGHASPPGNASGVSPSPLIISSSPAPQSSK